MWAKRISEIVAADIRTIVSERRQEGIELEFKRETSGPTSGQKAARSLAAEVVAFLNTHGGTLLLGIEEDGDHRAKAFYPVDNCRTVAKSLGASVVDLIDPRPAGFEFEGIPLDEAGSGVIVMRVPPSLLRPHWLRDGPGGICYVRRNTSSVPCTMREIQDLVRQTDTYQSKMADLIGRSLGDREDGLHPRFQFDGTINGAFTLKLFAIPEAPMQIEPPPYEAPAQEFWAVPIFRGGLPVSSEFVAVRPGRWRAVLRGREAVVADDHDEALILRDRQDGSVGLGVAWARQFLVPKGAEPNAPRYSIIPEPWLIGAFASVLGRLGCLRQRSDFPDAPYQIIADVSAPGGWVLGVSTEQQMNRIYRRWTFREDLRIVLPKYSVSDYESFEGAINRFSSDIRSLAGNQPGDAIIEIRWPLSG